LKILFLSRGLSIGGVETNLVLLAEELQSRGHEVTVASGGGRLTDDLEATGARHFTLRMSPRDLPSIVHDVRSLRRFVLENKPDIAHVFAAAPAVLLWAALRFPTSGRPGRVPVISTIMGLHEAPDEQLWRVMVRMFATTIGSQRIVVISPTIDRLIRRLRISRDRVVYQSVAGVRLPSPCLADSRSMVSLRQDLGIAPRGFVVTTIGWLGPRKSHELFVQAAARLLVDRPEGQFFIVGEGPMRAALRDQIEALGIGGRVRLLGERTDLTELLSLTDVYVRPGVVEGFIGLTVLHAQALGVPVVSFDTEDVRLAITDHQTGILVPKGDVGGLAKAVTALLNDADFASHLAQAGRAHVEANFSLPAVVDGLESLYREAVAQPVARTSRTNSSWSR